MNPASGLLLGVCAGALIGYVARIAVESHVEERPAGTVSRPVQSMDELAHVREDIAALRRDVNERLETNGTERGRIPVASANDAEAAVKALTDRVSELEAHSRSNAMRARVALVEGHGYASLDTLWMAIDKDAVAMASSACDGRPSVSGGLSRDHLLWSPDRLIAQYGMPTRVHFGAPMTMQYFRDPEAAKSMWIVFSIQDGLVWCVELNR